MHVSGAVVVGDDARAYGRWVDLVFFVVFVLVCMMRDVWGM